MNYWRWLYYISDDALPVPFRPNRPLRVSLVATSAIFILVGIQAIFALATTPKVDAFTARCGA